MMLPCKKETDRRESGRVIEGAGLVLLVRPNNGAQLSRCGTPCTPSLGERAVRYFPTDGLSHGHRFKTQFCTDIVASHGPPKGNLGQYGSRTWA